MRSNTRKNLRKPLSISILTYLRGWMILDLNFLKGIQVLAKQQKISVQVLGKIRFHWLCFCKWNPKSELLCHCHDTKQMSCFLSVVHEDLHCNCASYCMSPCFCQVRHGPGSTYFVDPLSTSLSQNVIRTQSIPLNLTLPITFP